MKKLFTCTLFALLFFSASCQPDQARLTNWEKDLDFLLVEIKKQHYVYKNQALPDALTQQLNQLKQHITDYSDERMLIELERIMYHLGDGHSYILPFGANIVQAHFLPLQLYYFSDGMYVVDASPPYTHLIGQKVKKLGPVDPQKFMKDMVQFISQDNEMGAQWIGPFFLRFRGMLEAYGLSSGAKDILLEALDSKGKTQQIKVPFVPVPRMRGIPKMPAYPKTVGSTPLYLTQVQKSYWLQFLPEQNALYFQFNQVMNEETESLANFTKKLEQTLLEKKPAVLIVDVRHNNGGNGDLTPPLIAVLKNYEQKQKGKIAVLTGRNTFSAAQIFIAGVNRETKAVFVGEPSSSRPNFVGEENMLVLPYSGALGSISNRYHENIPGDQRKWIEPEVKVNLSSKDYFAGRDPVLAAVFKYFRGS